MGRRGPRADPGATFDTGALIAIDRGEREMSVLVSKATKRNVVMAVPAAVLAQAWRDPRTQVRLTRFVESAQCEVVPLDRRTAKRAGQLCAATGTSDVVDASVVVCAHDRGQPVVTSDPDDLRRLDPHLRLLPI